MEFILNWLIYGIMGMVEHIPASGECTCVKETINNVDDWPRLRTVKKGGRKSYKVHGIKGIWGGKYNELEARWCMAMTFTFFRLKMAPSFSGVCIFIAYIRLQFSIFQMRPTMWVVSI